MRAFVLSLTATILAVALASPGDSRAAGEITVFRCVDAKGAVTLTDKPCPKTSSESTAREMTRPKDAPPRPVEPPREAPAPVVEDDWAYVPEREPPPPMFVCTSYDGIVRESEVYDPNPRCEPIVLYHPGAEYMSPDMQRACQWVEDSCVRLSDYQACERWRAKFKRARSDAMHADSTTQAYKKSELLRITQILQTHC
jgi:hypothetical protein